MIKAIPLHYWHEKMVRNVGFELGDLEHHELTKKTTRMRVLIDGLKPLVKQYIMEYESGEENIITLEYKN